MWSSVLDSPYAKHIEIVPQYDEPFLTQLMNTQDADVAREKAERKASLKRGAKQYSSPGVPITDFMSALESCEGEECDEEKKPLFKAKKVLIILDDVVDSLPSSNSKTIL